MQKSKVYFTKNIDSTNLIKSYEILNKPLSGKVAIKISSGEHEMPYIIDPKLMEPLLNKLKGTIIECNTGINIPGGRRFTTEEHMKTFERHGYTKIGQCEILDKDGDLPIKVNGGKLLKENLVGKGLSKFNSVLVLSHFKGHGMAGFGGALKNVAIGMASAEGKRIIHGFVSYEDFLTKVNDSTIPFIERMADAVKGVYDFLKGNMVFVSVMNHMSIDCDCVLHPKIPEINDIGILSSVDPVALDQACVDLIYKSKDKGRDDLVKRIEEKNGLHILECAESLGIGTRKYELIDLDK